MKNALLIALVVSVATPALAQKDTQQIAVKQNPTVSQTVSPRDAFRTKVLAAVTPANKPKVDGIIAILIGVVTSPPNGDIAKAFEISFNNEAKKAFPKADAPQLDALRDLVTLQLVNQLEERLAESRVRVGVIGALLKCKTDNACFEKATTGINRDKVNAIRKELENKTKDLEAAERMGNFEIQRLMSAYNQAETLSSSVLKKQADTQAALISKI